MKYYIYALCEPEGLPEVRYIGVTDDPIARLNEHHQPSSMSRNNSHKNCWLRSVVRRGLRARLITLLECPSKGAALTAEIDLIAYARSVGFRLTNTTGGGEGSRGAGGFAGKKHSDETKAKLSAATKAQIRRGNVRHRPYILSSSQAEAARLEFKSGCSIASIARSFGVSGHCMSDLLRGKTHRTPDK